MKISRKVVSTIGIVLLAAAAATAGGQFEHIVDETFALDPGGEVSIENINGDVTIEVWERNEVRVYAVKSASSQELLDTLEVEIDATSSAVRIETDYPSHRHDDEMESFRDRDRMMKVEYTITMPRTASVEEVDLVNGSLVIDGVEGGIDAETVNGNIVVRNASGAFDLATVNGDIELRADRISAADEVELESVNGRVDLYLSGLVSADIRAESLNGRLSNDFGIEVRKGKYIGADFSGTVGGGGGARIDLETVNGSIAVHRW